jgi:formylglycine-generating enzyme required for sulfatase activity
VGAYPPNPWGLHDMAGNVSEWTASGYDAHYKFSEVSSDRTAQRVFRGGSWFNLPSYLRSAYRSLTTPDNRFNTLGFRLSRM